MEHHGLLRCDHQARTCLNSTADGRFHVLSADDVRAQVRVFQELGAPKLVGACPTAPPRLAEEEDKKVDVDVEVNVE